MKFRKTFHLMNNNIKNRFIINISAFNPPRNKRFDTKRMPTVDWLYVQTVDSMLQQVPYIHHVWWSKSVFEICIYLKFWSLIRLPLSASKRTFAIQLNVKRLISGCTYSWLFFYCTKMTGVGVFFSYSLLVFHPSKLIS